MVLQAEQKKSAFEKSPIGVFAVFGETSGS